MLISFIIDLSIYQKMGASSAVDPKWVGRSRPLWRPAKHVQLFVNSLPKPLYRKHKLLNQILQLLLRIFHASCSGRDKFWIWAICLFVSRRGIQKLTQTKTSAISFLLFRTCKRIPHYQNELHNIFVKNIGGKNPTSHTPLTRATINSVILRTKHGRISQLPKLGLKTVEPLGR